MSAPVDHPPPWRWSPLQVSLWDANDKDVIAAPCDACGDLMPIEGSPGALELIRIAPEAERLLREFEWRPGQHDPPGTKRKCLTCAADHVCGEPHDPGCRIAALLAGLDATRKAGG